MNRNTIGEINYYSSSIDEDSPWIIASSIPTEKRSNFIQTPVRMTIHDLRDKEKNFNLDKNGFEVVKYNGSIQTEFEEGSEIQKTYFDEISELLKKRLNASRVIISHFAFRCRNSTLTDDQCNDTHRNPVLYPHVDADLLTVEDWLDDVLGKEEREKAFKNRIQMINVWRPLGTNPIVNKPLTMCDYNSIDIDKDIHPLTIRRSDHNATAYTISQNAQDRHKWCYLSEMKPDEMFIFKNFDSKPDVAQYAVHTAFDNSNASTSNFEQKSVELRCFIFYDV